MNKLKVLIVWFQALNGIMEYYPDARTSNLQKSKYLKLYSLAHSLFMVCGLPSIYLDFMLTNPVLFYKIPSNWFDFGTLFSIVLYTIGVFLAIHVMRFQKSSIQRIYDELKNLDLINPVPNDLRFLNIIQFIKLINISTHLGVLFYFCYLYIGTTDLMSWFYIIYYVWMDNLISAMSVVMHEILWKICYCSIGMRLELNQLLSARVKLQKLLQLFKRQQDLIKVCSKFSDTFRHLLLWYSLRTLLICVLSGYIVIRIQITRKELFFSGEYAIFSLTEFYLLNYMAEFVADLIPDTIQVLRLTDPQDLRIKRAITWMDVQLSCQSTEIRIYGAITLNRRFCFVLMTEIVLNTIYMVQSDYFFLE
ncbi:hypothetical protein KR093_009242 [Drosophila rubida]|uniref:Gustatory receptor n=1 Tax=Drosophila rubida TaxID=30044 RepID=A0AAD4PM46_9MUSC|nr:hypothetical protein KR093_009242 [Drosophila rubida]